MIPGFWGAPSNESPHGDGTIGMACKTTLLLACAVCTVTATKVVSKTFTRQRFPRAGSLLPASGLKRSCLLRGGDSGDTATEELVGRLRLSVADGSTEDTSLCEVNPSVLAQMGIEAGDHLQLRGRKQRKTVCIAMPDNSLAQNEARLSTTALRNIGLKIGESIIVTSTPMEDAKRVLLLPFASSLSGFDGDPFEDCLKPFLQVRAVGHSRIEFGWTGGASCGR